MTIHDCEVQTFTSGGPGGQHQNRSRTGVRVIHHPSGARGESREERSQLQNKRAAFRRMAGSAAFRMWLALETGRIAHVEAEAQRLTIPDEHLRIEVRRNGRWVEVRADELAA